MAYKWGVYLLLTNWDIGMILQAHPWRLTWLAMDNEPGLKMYFPRYMGIFCCYVSLPEAHKRNTKPHWTELLNNICEQNWFETSWFWSFQTIAPLKVNTDTQNSHWKKILHIFPNHNFGYLCQISWVYLYNLVFHIRRSETTSWGYLESTPLRKRCRKSRVRGKVLNLSTQQWWFHPAVGWVI